jgi:hypothetical protein
MESSFQDLEMFFCRVSKLVSRNASAKHTREKQLLYTTVSNLFGTVKYSIKIVLKKNMNQAKPMVFLQSFYELLPSSWWPQAAFGRWIVGLPSRSLLPICIGLDKRNMGLTLWRPHG